MESEYFIEKEDIVSMRCLRHKKRFNVEREWTEKCQWLCPQCHSALSEEEREKYRPKSGVLPEIREAELGKPTMYPKFTLPEHLPPIIDDNEVKEEISDSCHDTEELKPQKNTVSHKCETRPISKVSDNPSFRGLLPRFRIHCLKCGETVPCHYSWFDNSTVLCPECYGRMGKDMISLFHSKHKVGKPEFTESTMSLYDGPPAKDFEKKETKESCPEHDIIGSIGGWSNDRIMSATKLEMIKAVEHGLLSKVRMKIELKRRANSQYYSMFAMPDMEKKRPTF